MQTKYKIGDEVWWFQSTHRFRRFTPGAMELVRDIITDIDGDILICWHGSHRKDDVWGTSRLEAWNRLKQDVDKRGDLDG